MIKRRLFFTVICCAIAFHGLSRGAVHGQDTASKTAQTETTDFILGADITLLKNIEECGGIFCVNRVEKDALTILHDHWFRYLRWNLFHTPEAWQSNQGLATTLAMAKRIKSSGCKFLLDLHYSDDWANPGVQAKPKAWQNLSFATLKDSVYRYTRNVITTFCDHGALPDMVQLGNEITYGMLWDDGRVGGSFDTPAQWQKLAALLKEAIRGVHDGCPENESIKIMIHIDSGGSKEITQWSMDHLWQHGVDFDIIGLSFYSYWDGRINNLEENLAACSEKYKKDIIIVETSYPWTLADYDQVSNWMSDPTRLHPGYPPSVSGQYAFLRDLLSALHKTPHGRGLFYWQPIDIVQPRCGCGGENLSLFDFQGVLLPSIKAFAPADVAEINVRVNVASIPDTAGHESFLQLRGSLNTHAPVILPDGNALDWTDASEIELVHQSGDQQTATFYAPVGSQLRFKFWSRDIWQSGLGNGWETGDLLGDGDGNTVVSITGDTTLPVHFFNGSTSKRLYGWRPWPVKRDSTAVWFRVYMNTLEGRADGYVPGKQDLIIGIRGDPLAGFGPLDYGATRAVLKREWNDNRFAGSHLYSGVVYYAKSLAGQTQKFKYIIAPASWEEGNLTGDRRFTIPAQDTTLQWVYYGNTAPLVQGSPRVTLRLNASSIPDTIRSTAVFEVRGSINGVAPCALPDGNTIDWSEQSTLEMTHSGGDYFDLSFLVPEGANLAFKFWSQDAERLGLHGGWDDGDIDGDAYGNTVASLPTNRTFPLHFFNCSGGRQKYQWRPWQSKNDTIAVWFRVFMNTIEGIGDGYNPYSGSQTIGVRGAGLLGWIHTLDWERTAVALQRESREANHPGFHLFSGVAYYPKLQVLHPPQLYKFIIDPYSWEEGNLKSSRTFFIPDQDTTLRWVYYGDTAPRPSGAISPHERADWPETFFLSENYPNPFNAGTKIHYHLPCSVEVRMEIYNLAGQRVKTIVNQKQAAGFYDVYWDGTREDDHSASSGIYWCRIQADDFLKNIKMLLIR